MPIANVDLKPLTFVFTDDGLVPNSPLPFVVYKGALDILTTAPEFGALMAEFLQGLPDGGLVMCHPGFVDDLLVSLDPLTTQREREYAYLAGSEFPDMLRRNGVALA